MSEILSIDEINKRFPDEWVVVDHPETTEAHDVLAGKVVAHSPTREEVHKKIMELPVPRNLAVFHTGAWTGDSDEAYTL